jgi:hypothetical protein
MGDTPSEIGAVTTSHLPDVGKKFFQDSTPSDFNEGLGAKLSRVAEVTKNGFEETPTGIKESAKEFIKPENWGKDALMIGSSAAFGAVARVVLPESGALKTVAGVVMGGMFLKDAAMPVINSWGKVWNDSSSQTMTAASKNMGHGLGDFAVQGTISVVAAGVAAKFTPDVMNKVAPTTWSKIETWKSDNLVTRAASVSLAKPATMQELTVAPKPEVKIQIDRPVPTGVADVAGRPSVKDLSPEQLTDLLKSSSSETARITSGKIGRVGIKGSDGNYHSIDDAIRLLMEGKDPRVEAAGTIATAKSLRISDSDLSKPESIVIGEQPAGKGLPTEETADARGRRSPGQPTDRTPGPKPTGGDGTTKAPTDAAAQPTDLTRPTKEGDGNVTEIGKFLNAKNLAAQAAAIKDSLGRISDQDGLIMDDMNRTTGAIDVRTNPNAKPLLGYEVARQAAFDLAQQVGTDPANFMQVRDLFARFAAGALQSGSMDSSDIAAHVARMDLFAKENFETYRNNIIQAGIDPDVALARKPAPPLVEGTSDVQQIGVDASGNPVYSHEGPHTLRAIYGPNEEPVWPLDMVKTPIREMGMRGVNTSGIYEHEFKHDQFGQMGKFDPEVRDAKLGQAAAKAWGDDANKMVDLPNGGKDPQQVLLDAVVKKMEKVEPAQQDAFLTDQLGLDPQTRVIRGARAAVTVLGDVAKSPVQVPGPDGNPVKISLAELIGNIAAEADQRTPSQVLAEMQGKGTPAETEKAIAANVTKMLGANGQQMLPLADGSKISLADAVIKVSDVARNPRFDTYDKALPAQMSNADILVNIAKAWADETFADWGAASGSGQTAAPYFQALSKDGLLRGATVMGQEMRDPENLLGIEAHPTDLLRPRYQSALIRALATAKGQHDQVLLDWADALDKYSRDASKPGPVTFPSLDTPGQSIKIPQEVFDKFIPELVDTQLNTPLPRLQGKTLFDILPDLRKNMRINLAMSDTWVDAIKAGKGPEGMPFDAHNTKITNVYGAGQPAFLKLVAGGMDPIEANDAVNRFSDFFGDQIVKDRAQAPAAPTAVHKLQFASMARGGGDPTVSNPLGNPFETKLTAGISGVTADGTLDAGKATVPGPLSQGARWIGQALTGSPAISAYSAYQVQDLLGLHKVQQDVLEQNK